MSPIHVGLNHWQSQGFLSNGGGDNPQGARSADWQYLILYVMITGLNQPQKNHMQASMIIGLFPDHTHDMEVPLVFMVFMTT